MYDTLNFDDHIVQQSVSVIYLGIIFDEQLNFKLHINAVRDKIAKGIGMISMCSYFIPRNCLISVYNSFVLPYLMYCIEIWGNSHTNYLQPVRVLQKKCIRLIANVPINEH